MKSNADPSTITHPAQGIERHLKPWGAQYRRVEPWPVVRVYEENGVTITVYAPGRAVPWV